VQLLTVGHGTMSGEGLRLEGRRVGRRHAQPPWRRHNPHFSRNRLDERLPPAGLSYRWESRLAEFGRPEVGSPNVALCDPSFRGYADYMTTSELRAALDGPIGDARLRGRRPSCAPKPCGGAATGGSSLIPPHWSSRPAFATSVTTVGSPHRLTDRARLDGSGGIAYDGGLGRSSPDDPEPSARDDGYRM